MLLSDPPCDSICSPSLLSFIQVVSRAPQTAVRRWSATARTRGPPPSPSSLSPSTTSSPPNPRSPSPCGPCSQATSLGCRPAPAPAPGQGLGLTLEDRWGRTGKMQQKMCTDTRGLWLQQPLLLAQSGLRLLGATPRSGPRGRPAPGPAPPAPRAPSLRTASPARCQQASAPCTLPPRESREGVRCRYPRPPHLRLWG